MDTRIVCSDVRMCSLESSVRVSSCSLQQIVCNNIMKNSSYIFQSSPKHKKFYAEVSASCASLGHRMAHLKNSNQQPPTTTPYPSRSSRDRSAVRQPGIDLPEDLAASFHDVSCQAKASNDLIACYAVHTVFPPQP